MGRRWISPGNYSWAILFASAAAFVLILPASLAEATYLGPQHVISNASRKLQQSSGPDSSAADDQPVLSAPPPPAASFAASVGVPEPDNSGRVPMLFVQRALLGSKDRTLLAANASNSTISPYYASGAQADLAWMVQSGSTYLSLPAMDLGDGTESVAVRVTKVGIPVMWTQGPTLSGGSTSSSPEVTPEDNTCQTEPVQVRVAGDPSLRLEDSEEKVLLMDIAIWDKSVTKAVHDLLTDVTSDTVSVVGAKVFAVYQLVEAVAPNGAIYVRYRIVFHAFDEPSPYAFLQQLPLKDGENGLSVSFATDLFSLQDVVSAPVQLVIDLHVPTANVVLQASAALRNNVHQLIVFDFGEAVCPGYQLGDAQFPGGLSGLSFTGDFEETHIFNQLAEGKLVILISFKEGESQSLTVRVPSGSIIDGAGQANADQFEVYLSYEPTTAVQEALAVALAIIVFLLVMMGSIASVISPPGFLQHHGSIVATLAVLSLIMASQRAMFLSSLNLPNLPHPFESTFKLLSWTTLGSSSKSQTSERADLALAYGLLKSHEVEVLSLADVGRSKSASVSRSQTINVYRTSESIPISLCSIVTPLGPDNTVVVQAARSLLATPFPDATPVMFTGMDFLTTAKDLGAVHSNRNLLARAILATINPPPPPPLASDASQEPTLNKTDLAEELLRNDTRAIYVDNTLYNGVTLSSNGQVAIDQASTRIRSVASTVSRIPAVPLVDGTGHVGYVIGVMVTLILLRFAITHILHSFGVRGVNGDSLKPLMAPATFSVRGWESRALTTDRFMLGYALLAFPIIVLAGSASLTKSNWNVSFAALCFLAAFSTYLSLFRIVHKHLGMSRRWHRSFVFSAYPLALDMMRPDLLDEPPTFINKRSSTYRNIRKQRGFSSENGSISLISRSDASNASVTEDEFAAELLRFCGLPATPAGTPRLSGAPPPPPLVCSAPDGGGSVVDKLELPRFAHLTLRLTLTDFQVKKDKVIEMLSLENVLFLRELQNGRTLPQEHMIRLQSANALAQHNFLFTANSTEDAVACASLAAVNTLLPESIVTLTDTPVILSGHTVTLESNPVAFRILLKLGDLLVAPSPLASTAAILFPASLTSNSSTLHFDACLNTTKTNMSAHSPSSASSTFLPDAFTAAITAVSTIKSHSLTSGLGSSDLNSPLHCTPSQQLEALTQVLSQMQASTPETPHHSEFLSQIIEDRNHLHVLMPQSSVMNTVHVNLTTSLPDSNLPSSIMLSRDNISEPGRAVEDQMGVSREFNRLSSVNTSFSERQDMDSFEVHRQFSRADRKRRVKHPNTSAPYVAISDSNIVHHSFTSLPPEVLGMPPGSITSPFSPPRSLSPGAMSQPLPHISAPPPLTGFNPYEGPPEQLLANPQAATTPPASPLNRSVSGAVITSGRTDPVQQHQKRTLSVPEMSKKGTVGRNVKGTVAASLRTGQHMALDSRFRNEPPSWSSDRKLRHSNSSPSDGFAQALRNSDLLTLAQNGSNNSTNPPAPNLFSVLQAPKSLPPLPLLHGVSKLGNSYSHGNPVPPSSSPVSDLTKLYVSNDVSGPLLLSSRHGESTGTMSDRHTMLCEGEFLRAGDEEEEEDVEPEGTWAGFMQGFKRWSVKRVWEMRDGGNSSKKLTSPTMQTPRQDARNAASPATDVAARFVSFAGAPSRAESVTSLGADEGGAITTTPTAQHSQLAYTSSAYTDHSITSNTTTPYIAGHNVDLSSIFTDASQLTDPSIVAPAGLFNQRDFSFSSIATDEQASHMQPTSSTPLGLSMLSDKTRSTMPSMPLLPGVTQFMTVQEGTGSANSTAALPSNTLPTSHSNAGHVNSAELDSSSLLQSVPATIQSLPSLRSIAKAGSEFSHHNDVRPNSLQHVSSASRTDKSDGSTLSLFSEVRDTRVEVWNNEHSVFNSGIPVMTVSWDASERLSDLKAQRVLHSAPCIESIETDNDDADLWQRRTVGGSVSSPLYRSSINNPAYASTSYLSANSPLPVSDCSDIWSVDSNDFAGAIAPNRKRRAGGPIAEGFTPNRLRNRSHSSVGILSPGVCNSSGNPAPSQKQVTDPIPVPEQQYPSPEWMPVSEAASLLLDRIGILFEGTSAYVACEPRVVMGNVVMESYVRVTSPQHSAHTSAQGPVAGATALKSAMRRGVANRNPNASTDAMEHLMQSGTYVPLLGPEPATLEGHEDSHEDVRLWRSDRDMSLPNSRTTGAVAEEYLGGVPPAMHYNDADAVARVRVLNSNPAAHRPLSQEIQPLGDTDDRALWSAKGKLDRNMESRDQGQHGGGHDTTILSPQSYTPRSSDVADGWVQGRVGFGPYAIVIDSLKTALIALVVMLPKFVQHTHVQAFTGVAVSVLHLVYLQITNPFPNRWIAYTTTCCAVCEVMVWACVSAICLLPRHPNTSGVFTFCLITTQILALAACAVAVVRTFANWVRGVLQARAEVMMHQQQKTSVSGSEEGITSLSTFSTSSCLIMRNTELSAVRSDLASNLTNVATAPTTVRSVVTDLSNSQHMDPLSKPDSPTLYNAPPPPLHSAGTPHMKSTLHAVFANEAGIASQSLGRRSLPQLLPVVDPFPATASVSSIEVRATTVPPMVWPPLAPSSMSILPLSPGRAPNTVTSGVPTSSPSISPRQTTLSAHPYAATANIQMANSMTSAFEGTGNHNAPRIPSAGYKSTGAVIQQQKPSVFASGSEAAVSDAAPPRLSNGHVPGCLDSVLLNVPNQAGFVDALRDEATPTLAEPPLQR